MKEKIKPKPIVIRVPPVVINISPVAFYEWAKQFNSAARLTPRQKGFSPVPYFLQCRALELVLKAYLFTKGWTTKKVKSKISHDLVKGLKFSIESGLEFHVEISQDHISEVAKANKYYNSKRFEYFDVMLTFGGLRDRPNISTLNLLNSRLLKSLKKVCYDAA